MVAGRAHQFSIFADVDHGDPVELIRRREKERVLHSQWAQDAVGDEVLILLAGADLDDATEDLDSGAGIAPGGSRAGRAGAL